METQKCFIALSYWQAFRWVQFYQPSPPGFRGTVEAAIMLRWTLILFIISALAGFVGFSATGALVAGPAKMLFFFAAAMFLVCGAAMIFSIQ